MSKFGTDGEWEEWVHRSAGVMLLLDSLWLQRLDQHQYTNSFWVHTSADVERRRRRIASLMQLTVLNYFYYRSHVLPPFITSNRYYFPFGFSLPNANCSLLPNLPHIDLNRSTFFHINSIVSQMQSLHFINTGVPFQSCFYITNVSN
jgi:hypothetical protein